MAWTAGCRSRSTRGSPTTRSAPWPRPARCGGSSTGLTCSSRSRPPGRACPRSAPALAEGISINVTLIFSLARYGEVIEAFLTGMGNALAPAPDGTCPASPSVASFFVSRVDTEVDRRLDKLGTGQAAALRGKAAIANARLAYQRYEDIGLQGRWKSLEGRAPGRSARCGRPPASRTPPTTTPGMSPTWFRAPVWSTPCRRGER